MLKLPSALLTIVCALAFSSTLLLGCKKEPSLVGKWEGAAQGQNAILEFKDDKTVSIEIQVASATITLSGDYKLDGKNFSMTLKKADKKNVPAQLAPIIDQGLKSALNKETKSTVEFNTEDEVTMTSNGKTEKLTRVKPKA